MSSKLFKINIITIITNLLLKKNQKLSLQTVTEKSLIKMSKSPLVSLILKIKQKINMSRRLLISIKKPKRRLTTKIPPLKPVDKFKSKMNSLMVTKPVSLLLLRRNQLLLQLRKTIKLFHIPHLNHTNKRKNP